MSGHEGGHGGGHDVDIMDTNGLARGLSVVFGHVGTITESPTMVAPGEAERLAKKGHKSDAHGDGH